MVQMKINRRQIKKSQLETIVGILVGVVLLLAFEGISWAACDPSFDCDSCATKGERMKCKFDSLANETNTLLDRLQGPPFDKVQTEASMDGLKRSKVRLGLEKDHLKADNFRLLTKKKETSCQVLEVLDDNDGNDDGICDKGEQCAEALDDGIGDDDGICWPMKGKKREVCAQICDDEATLQDENNVDDDLSAELEGVFDEMKGHAKEMNESLQEVSTLMYSIELSQNPNDPCPLDTEGLSRTSAELYALAKGAAVGARGGADIAERLCDQQVIMNCASCCAPGEVIAGALEAAWVAIEITESTINSATIDTALSCVAKLKTSASDNTALLLQIENNLRAIEQSQAAVIEWLNTPQGQRPYFSESTTTK